MVGFNYENEITFYTRYGDIFAWICVVDHAAAGGVCHAEDLSAARFGVEPSGEEHVAGEELGCGGRLRATNHR